MKNRLILLLTVCVLLAGCGGETVPAAEQVDEASGTLASQPEDAEGPKLPEISEPEDVDVLTPVDFGCLTEEFETKVSCYSLLERTELELSVTCLEGAEEGETLYVVGGIHGDEPAGWYAGELLKKGTLRRGTVYVAAPVNAYGAEHDRRTTQSGRDLNRNFPGSPDGVDAQRLAYAIFADIRQKAPALVLDMHEARNHGDGRDNLGNSVICLDIQPVEELIFDLLTESSLAPGPLDLFGAPPAGSLNRTVTEELNIPVITLETPREEPLSLRVRTQLRVAEFVLNWYGQR